jgi:glycosyltransferase involved in cell wall biosynthesis
MKPKILLFSLAYSPLWGGAEIAVKEITDRIADADFDMITKKFGHAPAKERIGNINIYRINSPKLIFPFLAYFKARRLHKKSGYNIIWSIMANRAGLAALFFKLNFPKIKFLLTLQEGDPFSYIKKRSGFIWPLIKPLFKKIFTRADHIQAISTYLAGWAKNMKATCPVEVIPNGVDIKKFKAQNEKRKINVDETVLITTSRLVPKNGIADLVEATKILLDEGYKIKTLILGEGPLEENLKFKIKNLKLQNEVMLPGHIPPEKIPEYLKKANIFVRPSLSEGLGNSFLEAMAAGLPVIGTSVGGIPDFLKNGETGLFCEVNNPPSIAEKVKEYINNPGRTDKIVENAQKLVREKYNWDNIAAKMQLVFSKI